MTLYFVTGNKNKLREVKQILPGVKQFDPDVEIDELQILDPSELAARKVKDAALAFALDGTSDDGIFVEDVSFHMAALKGENQDLLQAPPGPFIKFFVQPRGAKGIYEMIQGSTAPNKDVAVARCTIGYWHQGLVYTFDGQVHGKIVSPRGESKFGFDPCFQPDGYDQTYAEMSRDLKNRISHRRMALDSFVEYLSRTGGLPC